MAKSGAQRSREHYFNSTAAKEARKIRGRARQAAFARLRDMHPAAYLVLYQAELAKLKGQGE